MVTMPIIRTTANARAIIAEAKTKGYKVWISRTASRQPTLCAGKDSSAPATWTYWCPEQIARNLQLD